MRMADDGKLMALLMRLLAASLLSTAMTVVITMIGRPGSEDRIGTALLMMVCCVLWVYSTAFAALLCSRLAAYSFRCFIDLMKEG